MRKVDIPYYLKPLKKSSKLSARTMSEFDHPNILKLIGVALDDSSHLPIIITEYMAKGDLKSFIENVENTIKMRDLFEFAFDIAKGMNYMHSKKFIHRDLACRNCLFVHFSFFSRYYIKIPDWMSTSESRLLILVSAEKWILKRNYMFKCTKETYQCVGSRRKYPNKGYV